MVTLPFSLLGLVWFGLVLWHINHSRLFNAKSSLYIYIKYRVRQNDLTHLSFVKPTNVSDHFA